MGSIFESIMLICFGLSWPLNVVKAYKARTAKGTSLPFIILIITGYIAGITAKIITGQINYVLIVYLLNLITTSSLACAFLPNTNMNFYKYFLASSSADFGNIVTKLFTTPVCLNMNFVLSIIIYIAYILIFNLISTAVIKCRDF